MTVAVHATLKDVADEVFAIGIVARMSHRNELLNQDCLYLKACQIMLILDFWKISFNRL